MFNCGRRDFLKGMMASAAVATMSGMKLHAAVPAGTVPKLRFGAVSDVHISKWAEAKHWNTDIWEKTLKWYRDQKVDAVLVAGDIADWGMVEQLQNFADAWYRVFPDDKAPDGRHVERIFVYGNHDIDGWAYTCGNDKAKRERYHKMSINLDRKKAWDICFHEEWQPIYTKVVNGYSFIGAHWGSEGGLAEYMEKAKANLDPVLPFFYTQHPHPGNTIYGPWAWGNDHGRATNVLKNFPNAVALTGHSHYPLTDEAGIWQDTFTSIGTGSLRYIGPRYGRENSEDETYDNGIRTSRDFIQMKNVPAHSSQQGLMFSIYEDEIHIAKRDFGRDVELADDWIVPLPINREKPYNHAVRKAKLAERLPAFAEGAAAQIAVTEAIGKNRTNKDVPQVTVEFPAALSGGQPYDYEVQAEMVMYDVTRIFGNKRVFGDKFFWSWKEQDKTAKCVFAQSELPQHVNLRFAITPMDCFGNRGKTIYSKNMKLGEGKPAENK